MFVEPQFLPPEREEILRWSCCLFVNGRIYFARVVFPNESQVRPGDTVDRLPFLQRFFIDPRQQIVYDTWPQTSIQDMYGGTAMFSATTNAVPSSSIRCPGESNAEAGRRGAGAKRNTYARVIGSATAGLSELLIFHPVDTVAKRLMSNQAVAVNRRSLSEATAALSEVCRIRVIQSVWRYCSCRAPTAAGGEIMSILVVVQKTSQWALSSRGIKTTTTSQSTFFVISILAAGMIITSSFVKTAQVQCSTVAL